MQQRVMRSLSTGLLLSLLLAACGGGSSDPTPDAAPDAPPPPPPTFRNPVSLPDDELAKQALALLGAPVEGHVERCNGCHGMTRSTVDRWAQESAAAWTSCLEDLDLSTPEKAKLKVDCARMDPSNGSSPFSAKRLGIYSTAARLPWFQYAFDKAFAGSTEQLDQFRSVAGMPQAGIAPLTQPEFDIVAEWFQRGLPAIDTYLPKGDGPDVCEPSITPAVATHVTAMQAHGWTAVNAEHGLLMHGCAGASSPRGCLADYPKSSATSFGTGWEVAGSALRVLSDNSTGSIYWTRSSADGRFVGLGSADDGFSRIIDLVGPRSIKINASYDPAFFPDDSAFLFQGNEGARICTRSVLTTGAPTQLDLDEAGCSGGSGVDLYEHVGASLDGSDYWAVDGQFESDDGGHQLGPAEDTYAGFDSSSTIKLTAMVNTGSAFEPRQHISVDAPNEGDHVLSPSAKLLISRTGGNNGRQISYVLHRIDVTGAAGNYQVTTPEIARYCAHGGKPAFSYDERWLVLHHYVGDSDAVDLGFTGPADPAFRPFHDKGAANIYLVDLLTGRTTRITSMHAGQYALYPHFRSDGWIYFLVRDPARDHEYVVASDAALAAP